MANITTAAREYASRPADERFPSLEAMIQNATHEQALCAERSYSLRDLKVVEHENGVALQSPKGIARFTHWSFGQMARTVGAPAGYLRSLSPDITATALNYGIHHHTAHGEKVVALLRAPNGKPEPVLRAVTTDSYARLWDGPLYQNIANMITKHDAQWTLPATWDGVPAGAYRGDRDSFLVLVNGGSIVNDPSARSNGAMFRGILVRNSEVGAASVTLETILFRYICGNHIFWGAQVDTRFRKRHIGSGLNYKTMLEIGRIAQAYTAASAAKDEAIIRSLINTEVATTKEGVISALRSFGASKEDAERAYQVTEEKESASPRSYWGLAQGLTRVSQETNGYQDERFALDRVALQLLTKGRKLVAA